MLPAAPRGLAVTQVRTHPDPDHTGAVTDTARCPGCDTAIDEQRVREQGGVERFSCLACGLQLVRRPHQRWESIRG
jgi:Zn ribbon nucleic-acid-binding protein